MKVKKRIKWLVTIVIVVTSVCLGKNSMAAGIEFSVNPIYNDHQIDNNKSFFYIQTKPGEEQILEFDVMSTQEEPVEIKVTPQFAYTQPNGQMGYTDDPEVMDSTLKDAIPTFFNFKEGEDIITVTNYETKHLKLKITPPKEHYEGVKAGAITFSLAPKEEKKAGVGIDYGIRIGLLTSESGDVYEDSTQLLLTDVKPTVSNSRKLVVAQLQNPEPKILVDLYLKGTIKDKETGKVIKTKEVEDYKLAPNSKFDFEFDWGIEDLPSGDFVMVLDGENQLETWHLEKEFKITGEMAKKLNKESAFKIVTPDWLKILTIGLGSLALMLTLSIFIRMDKRQKAWEKFQLTKRKQKRKSKRRKRNEKGH